MSLIRLDLLTTLFAALAVGAVLGPRLDRWANPAGPDPLVCRPTLPVTEPAMSGNVPVLFLGNSLVFDHDWDVEGIFPINCARQGMTVAALGDAKLPDIQPDLVVMGFGTVEVLHAGTGDLDIARFQAAYDVALDKVTTQYPEAGVLVLGLPDVPLYPNADIGGLNATLTELATRNGHGFAPNSSASTYDGAHIISADYEPWHRQISLHPAVRK